MRSLLPLSLVLLAVGCNVLKQKDKDGPASSSSAAATSATPTASASAAAKVSPCTVADATSVDTGVRADAGLTLVTLKDGRLALGYATGAGVPKVAILDAAGKASFPDLDDDRLKTKEKKDAKTQRTILRVTPLAFEEGSMKMRVGVDLLDHLPDKSTYLRCGPADSAPFLLQGGPDDNGTGDEGNIVDCRTFSSGHKEWVLASVVSIASAMEGKLPMRWIVDYETGRQPVENVILDEKLYDSKKLDKPEPYSYQVPVGIGVKDTGFVFASRQEGSLVMARRDAHLQKVGDAVRFGFGSAPPTMPALVGHEHQAAVFVGLFGKTDVYGATFALEAKPAKPEKIAIDDPSPPTAGDRNSLTASYTPKGDAIFLAFADGAAGSKKARMTVLGGDLKSTVPVFDVGTDSNVSELRVTATADDKAVVTYLAGNEIKTATVSCKY
jgi:hypothetical protein